MLDERLRSAATAPRSGEDEGSADDAEEAMAIAAHLDEEHPVRRLAEILEAATDRARQPSGGD